MAEPPSQTAQIQARLDRLHDGDTAAIAELLECACGRLRKLAHKMLRTYPNVHRWEQTDDVLQNAALRLQRTLGQLQVETPRDFFRLAALNIRRELLDLARHYYGPQGHGAHHVSSSPATDTLGARAEVAADTSQEPSRLVVWGEFHERIAALPEEEREIFDLLYYQGLSQSEAAALLGVSERTVKRRWQAGRLALHDALHGEVPE